MRSIVYVIFLLSVLALVIAYPKGILHNEDNQAEAAQRLERQAGGHHHDVVDFGAHTGHHGAFGWYADFPVHTHH